jgi:FtsP/CotA-like multicopper oxidase with cupredoxin domain
MFTPIITTTADREPVVFDLVAQQATVDVDGRPAKLFTYNGQLPGPLLRVREGDRVRIDFHNRLSEPTNLHLHGMRMPPEVDNPHLVVAPGESTSYEFDIPEGAAGTYWYHPHVHGEVAWQLESGLVGALIVEGPDEARGPLADAQEQVLVLQDLTLDRKGRPRPRTPLEMHDGRTGELILVNGQRTPSMYVDAGLVRLRLVNAGSARYYDIVLEGAQMYLIGLDAALLDIPVAIDHVLLPPGQRADILVRATEAGALVLRQRPYHRGVMSKPRIPDDGVLATLRVQGSCGELAIAAGSRPVERLDPEDAVSTKVFEYGGVGSKLRLVSEIIRRKRYGTGVGATGPVRFWLNGKEFEPGRIDTQAELGTMQLWELRNPTPLDHPFHLHVHPFQVLDVDGRPSPIRAWQDVVNVPAGKTVRILVPFRDFTGKTMYHCHILEHEDNGMMGQILVAEADAPMLAG